MTSFTETTVQQAALAWLESTCCQIAHSRAIPAAERRNFGDVVPAQRLRDALVQPGAPIPAWELR